MVTVFRPPQVGWGVSWMVGVLGLVAYVASDAFLKENW
jgi:hypothetical protein